MSRIVITAIGTWGDVGPAIFLARKLAGGTGIRGGCGGAAAPEVVLVAPPENEPAARRAGVDFRPIGARFSDVVARGSLSEYRGQIRLQFREHLDLYRDAALLVGFSLFYAGRSIAERLGLPYRHVFFTPQVFRSPSTTPPSARRMSRSSLVNRLLWHRHLAQEDFVVGRIVNEERTRLGLPVQRHASDARTGPGTVLAVDSLFARLPHDLAGGNAGIRQAHYWYHEGEDALDPDAMRFLEAGEPPILVSFGSADCVMKDAPAAYARLCRTLTGDGHRVLLVTSQPVADDLGGSVHRATRLPHAKVMPRCCLVIHHGGIGTVFAASHAGIPQLVVPWMLDQFFWATRVNGLGIGYGPLAAAGLAGAGISRAAARLAADEAVARRVREVRGALIGPAREAEVDAAIRDIFRVA
jgi:hypothetical protein